MENGKTWTWTFSLTNDEGFKVFGFVWNITLTQTERLVATVGDFDYNTFQQVKRTIFDYTCSSPTCVLVPVDTRSRMSVVSGNIAILALDSDKRRNYWYSISGDWYENIEISVTSGVQWSQWNSDLEVDRFFFWLTMTDDVNFASSWSSLSLSDLDAKFTRTAPPPQSPPPSPHPPPPSAVSARRDTRS